MATRVDSSRTQADLIEARVSSLYVCRYTWNYGGRLHSRPFSTVELRICTHAIGWISMYVFGSTRRSKEEGNKPVFGCTTYSFKNRGKFLFFFSEITVSLFVRQFLKKTAQPNGAPSIR